jgi:hypothetical protein
MPSSPGGAYPTGGGAGVARTTTQRDVMRNLYRRLGGDHDRVVAAYAAAERRGEVTRASNVRHMEPEEYAGRLYADGVKKGWMR